MEYAVKTLQIELAKLEDAQRTQEKYSVYPEYYAPGTPWADRQYQIETALRILSANSGPLTARERWLIMQGFVAGYERGPHDTVESQYSDASECFADWLTDMGADAVTVEMVLAKDAPTN